MHAVQGDLLERGHKNAQTYAIPQAFSSPQIKMKICRPGRAGSQLVITFNKRFFRHQAFYSPATSQASYMSCQAKRLGMLVSAPNLPSHTPYPIQYLVYFGTG
jgi:hypothetical protein